MPLYIILGPMYIHIRTRATFGIGENGGALLHLRPSDRNRTRILRLFPQSITAVDCIWTPSSFMTQKLADATGSDVCQQRSLSVPSQNKPPSSAKQKTDFAMLAAIHISSSCRCRCHCHRRCRCHCHRRCRCRFRP
jgi:hypothetical protein